MTKVLWCSRHDLTEDQEISLRNTLKDEEIMIIQNKNRFEIDDLLVYCKRTRCNVLALVAPESILNEIKNFGVKVLIPEAKEYKGNGSNYIHDTWKVLV